MKKLIFGLFQTIDAYIMALGCEEAAQECREHLAKHLRAGTVSQEEHDLCIRYLERKLKNENLGTN